MYLEQTHLDEDPEEEMASTCASFSLSSSSLYPSPAAEQINPEALVSTRPSLVLSYASAMNIEMEQTDTHPSPESIVTILCTALVGTDGLVYQVDKEPSSSITTAFRCLLRHSVACWEENTVGLCNGIFYTLFRSATDAVSAAAGIQRCVVTHRWPGLQSMQVKMSLHTGEFTGSFDHDTAPVLQAAAHILKLAEGEQVLLSPTTYPLVRDILPPGVSLRLFGEYWLPPLQLHQPLFLLELLGCTNEVLTKELPEDRPFYNVPAFLTPLVGREQEVQAVCALLQDKLVRLVTVTGPGGVGKTRLSLEVGTRLRSTFPDGVCFVPLSTINKPLLVLPTITHQLGFGLRPTGCRWESASIETLKAFLHEKAFLLVLDNFEQVVSAAPDLTELLQLCPRLKLLVTSRAALHLRGEHLFPLAPLALPPHLPLQDGEDPTQYPTIQLFLQRAQAVMPNLVLTDATMQAIAGICVQLDGLPLALELAAARVKALPPQAMLPRLTHPLALLNGGLRDAPPRQQTLRKTLEWSYELLNAREQVIFRRLSLFTSGCALETIETIDQLVGDERNGEASVLEAVASLIDMSLLVQVDGEGEEPWFVMLATVREYALEMLEASGEQDVVRQAYLTYYLQLVERAESAHSGPQQIRWIQRIGREYGNISAALHWCLRGLVLSMEAPKRAEMALSLGGALSNFWVIHARVQEGREFLAQALAMQPQETSSKRAKVLLAAASLATTQSDFEQAEEYCLNALAIYQELEDQPGISFALHQLAWAYWGNNKLEEAHARATESLLLARAQGNKERLASSLHTLAFLESSRGQYTEVPALLEESILLYDALGQQRGIAWSYLRLAEVQLALQKAPAAIQKQLEECLAMFIKVGDKEGVAYTQLILGRVALLHDNVTTAVPLLQKSVKFYREMGRKGEAIFTALTALARGLALQCEETEVNRLSEEIRFLIDKITRQELLALALEGFAYVRVVRGELGWAVQLWARASALRAGKDGPVAPVEKVEYNHFVALVRNQLEESAFQKEWSLGSIAPVRQLLIGEVRNDILNQKKGQKTHRNISYPMGLSKREVQVLQLIAKGLTNAEVADALGLSKKTVAAHLTNIFNKTTTYNRAAAVAFAFHHGLA